MHHTLIEFKGIHGPHKRIAVEISKMIPGRIRFPLFSDLDGAIGRDHGMYSAHTGTDCRGRFIIDPERA